MSSSVCAWRGSWMSQGLQMAHGAQGFAKARQGVGPLTSDQGHRPILSGQPLTRDLMSSKVCFPSNTPTPDCNPPHCLAILNTFCHSTCVASHIYSSMICIMSKMSCFRWIIAACLAKQVAAIAAEQLQLCRLDWIRECTHLDPGATKPTFCQRAQSEASSSCASRRMERPKFHLASCYWIGYCPRSMSPSCQSACHQVC